MTELTKGLSIGVPLKRVRKKTAVYRTVMQHFMSEDVQDVQDEGRDLFALAETVMDALLAKRLPVAVEAEEVKGEGSGEGGVIAAMKPGSELRRYFESTPDVTEENFMQMLKDNSEIVNATKVLTELTSTWQEPTQGEREFFANMLRLKNTLAVVAEEEKFYMTHDMIYDTSKDAVSVGMRNIAVRLEFQPILDKRLPDEQMAIELNKIVTYDKEHQKKMGENNLKAQSN